MVSPTNIAIEDAGPDLFRLAQLASEGREIVFTRAGMPVAKIVPVNTPRPRPKAGYGKGTVISMTDDFDESLMTHRHLDTQRWSKAAIDSVIECGDLADWRELFHAVAIDEVLTCRVRTVIEAHPIDGGSALAKALIEELRPTDQLRP